MALIFAFLLCLSWDNERRFPPFSAPESCEMKTGLECYRQSWFPAAPECPVPTSQARKSQGGLCLQGWNCQDCCLPVSGCPWAPSYPTLLTPDLPAPSTMGGCEEGVGKDPGQRLPLPGLLVVIETGNWARTPWYCTGETSQQLPSAEHQGLILCL